MQSALAALIEFLVVWSIAVGILFIIIHFLLNLIATFLSGVNSQLYQDKYF